MGFTKKKNILLLFAFVLLSSYLVAYYVAISSNAYDVAKRYIYSDKVLVKRVGNIKNVSLKFFGYSIKFNNDQGMAEFDFTVQGTDCDVDVSVSLVENRKQWNVTSLIINEKIK